jgi:uncharacterized membrane protein YhaH (DUF805 family)
MEIKKATERWFFCCIMYVLVFIKIKLSHMNYFIDPLKKYTDFRTRTARKEFWMFTLLNLIVAVIVSIIASILDLDIIYYLYSIALIIPSIAIGVRRLHDTGRSGWWALIILVPIIGAITIICFYLSDSSPGDNEYGPNPKGVAVVI